MIAALTVCFLVLLIVEAAGLATFLVLHLRSDWRATPVGRHLTYYSGAFLLVYVTSIASFFAHPLWLGLVVMVLHIPLAVVIWQRVWLVLRRR